MSFEKKLVILTGKTGRGTALLERNGMGTFVTLNAFALPDLTAGEYALGVKTGTDVFRREIGSLGRIKSRFALPDGEYAAAHLVVFRTFDEEVVLYGTSSGRKMWEGNLMDGLRRNKVEAKTTDTGTNVAPTQEFHYSERKIEDYFLRIDPSSRYYDGALAEVNYFDYTPQEPTADTDVLYYDIPPTPGEMERMYLRNRFGGGVAVSQPQANEESAPSLAAAAADAVEAVVNDATAGGAAKAAAQAGAAGTAESAPAKGPAAKAPRTKAAGAATAAKAPKAPAATGGAEQERGEKQ